MTRTRTKLVFLTATALFALVSAAALAWACTAQPSRMAFFPAAGPSGTNLTIQGSGFAPGPVEVRWHSIDGPIIGQGPSAGPQFSVAGTIPDAAPGVYYAVVLQHDASGAVSMKAVDTFEVTNGSAQASKVSSISDGWSGFARSGAAQVSEAAPSASPGQSASPALGLALAGAGALGLVSFAAAALVRGHRRSA